MSNYWSPEAIAARIAASQQQQVVPDQPIPGSVPYTAPKVESLQPNTGQEESGAAGMQYNPAASSNQFQFTYPESIDTNNPYAALLKKYNESFQQEEDAEDEIEKNKNELSKFGSGEQETYDNQGNLITQKKLDNQNKLNDENALATGGGEGLLGKYIAEQNPELYGKMTDDEGLFQGGVEGRSFGRLKDFFEGQGSFWDKMKERRDQRMMQKSGFAGQDDIGSLKLSKEDNRHDGGSTGSSTGGQTKDDEGGLSKEQKIAMGQAFSQMAQGHRGSYGKYGDIF